LTTSTRTVLLLGLSLLVALVPFQAAQAQSLPGSAVGAVRPVPGHLVRRLAGANPSAPVDSGRTLQIAISLNPRNAGQLATLVAGQADPRSPQYRHFLSRQAVTDAFGPSQADADAVSGYLLAEGFQNVSVSTNRMLVHGTATVETVQRAFQVQLGEFLLDGKSVFAPLNEPSVPQGYATLVHAIYGLDNVPRFHPELTRSAARPAVGNGPAGGYTPGQLRTAYDANTLLNAANGSGQTVAVVEFDNYNAADVAAYASGYGLGVPSIRNVSIDGGPSGMGSGALEAELDMEVLAALAPAASQVAYLAPNSLQGELDMYNQIVSDDTAAVVSSSWGECEPFVSTLEQQDMNAILSQAAAQGQAIYSASGDSGAYDCGYSGPGSSLAVDFPSSNPNVVSVGGTTLSLASDGSYSSETAWGCSSCGTGGGGGLSALYARPSYQSGTGVINGYTNGARQVPDVSADADPETGYSVYCTVLAAGCPAAGGWMAVGGTSAAAPLWAALTTDWNQYAEAHGRSSVGSASTLLYQLFNTTQQHTAYHDVSAGNNLYYAAGSGYDLATGIGTPDAWNIAQDLTYVPPLASTSTVISCGPATVTAGNNTTCTATVTDTSSTPSSVTGTVTWSSSSGAASPPTCTLVPLTSTSASCSMSLQTSSAGTQTVNAAYSADAAHLASNGSFVLAVQAPTPQCSPRPPVSVILSPNAGSLQVTVAATGTANTLRSIQFGSAANGTIDAGSVSSSPGNFSWNLTSGPTQVSFTIHRSTAGSATTVALTVVDGCGSWQTFVGGGLSAF
jgi:subtilase family serine protease